MRQKSDLKQSKEENSENLISPDLDSKLSQLEILRQSIDEGKNREKSLMDRLLRLTAEFENFRVRSAKQISEARNAGREDILLPVIAMCDVLAQAVQTSDSAKDVDNVKKGIQLVAQQFERFLSENGVAPIPAVGEKLDPHLHEAISQEANSDKEEGTITAEIQRGYKLKDQVIRPARVQVAAPKKEEK